MGTGPSVVLPVVLVGGLLSALIYRVLVYIETRLVR